MGATRANFWISDNGVRMRHNVEFSRVGLHQKATDQRVVACIRGPVYVGWNDLLYLRSFRDRLQVSFLPDRSPPSLQPSAIVVLFVRLSALTCDKAVKPASPTC